MSAVAEDLDRSTSPFLTVVVPVGTTGTQALRESLLCLVGQDDVDFEVVLVTPPGAAPEEDGEVDEVVSDQPPRLAARLRRVVADAATPGAVRNAGLADAQGRFVTVLPEGDLVLGSWVTTFRAAEPSPERRLLRALGVTQEHSLVEVAGHQAVRADGPPRALAPSRFSLWQHALEPLSAPATWAWPRDLVRSHGLGYDATVTDDADWELLVRAAELVGVSDLEVVTSLHREWVGTAPASTGDGPTARDLIDARPLVVPPGEAQHLRAGSSESATTRALAQELTRTAEELRLTHDHAVNLEAVVRSLQDRLESEQDRHEQQVARLRRKLESARSARPGDGAVPTEKPATKGSWRRRGRGSGD
ncbi:hypothetical protein ASG76_11155 [Nocardioides sp. Soil774]|uniref:hypothetical protein n=1 Tax=Nocardioides sp. Soil774 TaxID=1736408 RepID=UPI0006FA971B|nr:hypothetical protein [Nocardioides sp. Soil774]KRE93968.1 hypothetical protein ASG76_11155 [Nocardioides sp. Soil774]